MKQDIATQRKNAQTNKIKLFDYSSPGEGWKEMKTKIHIAIEHYMLTNHKSTMGIIIESVHKYTKKKSYRLPGPKGLGADSTCDARGGPGHIGEFACVQIKDNTTDEKSNADFWKNLPIFLGMCMIGMLVPTPHWKNIWTYIYINIHI